MTKPSMQTSSYSIQNNSQENICPVELNQAIWLFRMVCFDLYPQFLKQDAAVFLELAGDNLVWSESALDFMNSRSDEIISRSKKLPVLVVDAEQSLIDEIAFVDLVKNHRALVHSILRESLDRLESIHSKESEPLRDNVQHLRNLLGLNETEVAILLYAGRMAQSKTARNLLRKIVCSSFGEAVRSLATILSLKPADVSKALRKGSPLNEYGFIKTDYRPDDLRELLTIGDRVCDFIYESHENLDDLIRHFIRPTANTSLVIEDFPHLEADYSALQSFIQGVNAAGVEGINFLFYGEPGTGKTEFVKLLAHATGLELYEVAFTDADGDPLPHPDRLVSLKIAQRFLENKPNCMIIFDEIEDIFPSITRPFGSSSLTSRVTSKAWINRCLEGNSTPVIWVSNKINQMDPAYLRRFSYHLEFRKPPVTVRSKIAKKYFSALPITSSFIKQIAEDTSLTPAQIEKAAQFVALSSVNNEKDAEALASRVIKLGKRAMGTDRAGIARTNSTQYDLDFLNIESRYPVERIVRALASAETSSLCFYGPPGTGKTALAGHIAKTLNKPLLVKRASDILSKWLGEAEQNIAEMFRQAESEEAILFLDEADSLLRDRKSSRHSWEVTQVNEMLQQMECFEGIFICATNLFNELDQAALRRFSFKLQFNSMTLEQRLRMFSHEAMGGATQALDTHLYSRLAQLNHLTPGDFAVVNRQTKVMEEAITAQDFMEMLEAEHALKLGQESKCIGF
jgi:SpoVK/Ycf46/Vps4 family AAA+-type ATPase